MNELLDDLSDDDRLRLHAAGELPPADSAALAARLAADPRLAGRARAMAADADAVDAALARADAVWPLPPAWPAARAFGDAARARVVAPPAPVPRPRAWRQAWVQYPLAAAVALAVGMGAWWVHVSRQPEGDGQFSAQLMALYPGTDTAVDPAGMTDDQVVGQFDSIVRDVDGRIDRNLVILDYLEKSMP